jgi:hypothetical protein
MDGAIKRKYGIYEALETLEGNEFQVVEVNDSRLDTILPVRRVWYRSLHFMI